MIDKEDGRKQRTKKETKICYFRDFQHYVMVFKCFVISFLKSINFLPGYQRIC